MRIEELESDPIEKLDELPVGSRMYVVSVLDPTTGRVVSGGTVIEVDRLDNIDKICERVDTPFREGLMHVAAEQVVSRMFQGPPPDGYEIKGVMEVSKRELRDLLAESEKARTERLSSENVS